MNFSKSTRATSSGNAMIYILIALALLGALTVAITNQSSDTSDDLSKEQAEFQVTQIVSYAAAAQNVIDQMVSIGTDPTTINFLTPSDSNFATAPHDKKIFHSEGGGLNYKVATDPLFDLTLSIGTPSPGWYVGRFNNTEWTPTSASDVMLVAYGINKKVCETINKKIKGNINIPTVTSAPKNTFVNGAILGYSNTSFVKSSCADCDGYASLCVTNNTSPKFYIYYSILLAQ